MSGLFRRVLWQSARGRSTLAEANDVNFWDTERNWHAIDAELSDKTRVP